MSISKTKIFREYMNKLSKAHLIIVAGLVLYCGIILSCSNRQQETSQTKQENHLIDSLIGIKTINDKTILLSFGADAITAIKTQKGIVVIDAGISTGLTSKYRKEIEEEFQSNDFAYVINTHSHPDHYGGNSVFHEAKIIGQKNGLEEITLQSVNLEKIQSRLLKIVEEYESNLKASVINTEEWYNAFTQKTRYFYALKDAEFQISIKQPELTFSDSLQIDMGDVSFEMIYFGKCHSNSDILIYIPELKILFTGDLFFKYGRPSINDSLMQDKVKWKQAIVWIEKLMPNIETIISAHGVLLSAEDIQYFNSNILEKSSN
jgi:cyclase